MRISGLLLVFLVPLVTLVSSSLYDPFGSYFRLKRRYIRALTAAGAQVAPSSKIYLIHTLTYRNHRKIAVIDGRAGYAGEYGTLSRNE